MRAICKVRRKPCSSTQALQQYYGIQASAGRGYAKLALPVVSNTGFEGQVAIQLLQQVGGSGVTPSTQTKLMVDLANADISYMNGHDGYWPTQADIETYHYTTYVDDKLPVFGWGGAAFAYFVQDWGGGALTSYEVGNGSHSTLFQTMTAEQVQQNVDTLTYDGMLKIGIAATEAAGQSRTVR